MRKPLPYALDPNLIDTDRTPIVFVDPSQYRHGKNDQMWLDDNGSAYETGKHRRKD